MSMLRVVKEALKAGFKAEPPAASRPRGMVEIDFARCTLQGACAEACPTPALRLTHDRAARRATLRLDLGQCVFCGLCEEACEDGAVKLGNIFELAVHDRRELVSEANYETAANPSPPTPRAPVAAGAASGHELRRRVLERFGRSLHVRHLDAGSCGGCESEIHAATNPVHDLTRYGIDFVASPRHADLLLVTGVLPPALVEVAREVYEAMPDPKLVVALGACAIGGGIHHAEDAGGAEPTLAVDVFVPGCPPPPSAILHGLLLAVGRAEPSRKAIRWRGPYPNATAAAGGQG